MLYFPLCLRRFLLFCRRFLPIFLRIRLRGCMRMYSSCSWRRLRAIFLFCCSERVAWHLTTIPLGTCRSCTQLLVLFTFCPPLPLPLINVSVISFSKFSISFHVIVSPPRALVNCTGSPWSRSMPPSLSDDSLGAAPSSVSRVLLPRVELLYTRSKARANLHWLPNAAE
jgi:hypothetical protein